MKNGDLPMHIHEWLTFKKKRERHFSATVWLPGRNWNFWNLIAHIKDIDIHILKGIMCVLHKNSPRSYAVLWCEKTLMNSCLTLAKEQNRKTLIIIFQEMILLPYNIGADFALWKVFLVVHLLWGRKAR